MESLATKAIISAHETVPGHSASSNFFTPSMNSNPLRAKFGGESFSALLFGVLLRRMDASQP
ncbi:hypothetical protein ACHQM5_024481 [Ranunculus cassubicifolius]